MLVFNLKLFIVINRSLIFLFYYKFYRIIFEIILI